MNNYNEVKQRLFMLRMSLAMRIHRYYYGDPFKVWLPEKVSIPLCGQVEVKVYE